MFSSCGIRITNVAGAFRSAARHFALCAVGCHGTWKAPATLVVLAIALMTGCGESGPPIARVDGVVTYGGKPVPYARVMFFPQNVTNGQIAFGQADEQGVFSKVLTGGKQDGAVVGHHFVTVTEGWPPNKEIPVDATGQEKSPPRGPWLQKYRDSTDPAIKVDVEQGKENHFEFDLSK